MKKLETKLNKVTKLAKKLSDYQLQLLAARIDRIWENRGNIYSIGVYKYRV